MSHSALLWVSACGFSLFSNSRFPKCHVYVLSNLDFTNRCAFFPGEIDKPAQGILQRGKLKAVSVGICLEGVYVMDVKEKVSGRLSWFIRVQSADTFAQCLFLSSFIFFFFAARAARPALPWAFLGPQLPRGGGGFAHSLAGVRWRGRRHSCEQVAEDLL